ncbi:hypothetical protein WJR50_11450 [Catalinimonas sp. 4WD22]|uniref:hypothetical protein n=1 Tax=Catalinimonas locisalis TaxID=3133978 RepID=UPI003100C3B6
MQNNEKELFKKVLQEDRALNSAWNEFWGFPENYELQTALKAQHSLQQNGLYIKSKLEKNTKVGKNYIALGAKEIHAQDVAEKAAFDAISSLVKEVVRQRNIINSLSSKSPN